MKFQVTSSTEYVIVKGLVVPAGSTVETGLDGAAQPWLPWPSLEASTAAFKQLFGVKKRRPAQEEEEEPAPIVAQEASDSESEESFVDSVDESSEEDAGSESD